MSDTFDFGDGFGRLGTARIFAYIDTGQGFVVGQRNTHQFELIRCQFIAGNVQRCDVMFWVA